MALFMGKMLQSTIEEAEQLKHKYVQTRYSNDKL